MTEDERSQMRSIIGSLVWIARTCRPDISCIVSWMQSCVGSASAHHIRELNKIVRYVVSTAEQGIYFAEARLAEGCHRHGQ